MNYFGHFDSSHQSFRTPDIVDKLKTSFGHQTMRHYVLLESIIFNHQFSVKMLYAAVKTFMISAHSNTILFHSIRALAFSLRTKKKLQTSEFDSVIIVTLKVVFLWFDHNSFSSFWRCILCE
jgi:hypothetical protein